MLIPPPQVKPKVHFSALLFSFLVLCFATFPVAAYAGTQSSGFLTYSPSSVYFGKLQTGQTRYQTVNVTNTGSASVTISSFSVGNNEFAVSGLTLPTTLTAGQMLSFTASFTPTQVGYMPSNITLVSNASNSPTVLNVHGTGINMGGLIANPASLGFGTVAVGSSNSLYETVTNAGATALTITQLTGANTPFSYSGLSLPLTLDAGGSVTFSVWFTPKSSGSFSGYLNLFAATTSLSVPLSGTAGSAGQLAVNPSSLNFGNVTVGTSSAQSATLTATNASVTISSGSSSSSEFVLSGVSFPLTLAANASASFTVTFVPQMSGSASGTLTFLSNASNSPTTQSVTGAGTAPPVYSVGLSWDAPSGDIVGYYVFRGTTPGGPYTQLNSAPDGGTSYTDSSVKYGTTYYYVSTSVGQNGQQSSYSNQTTAVIPPL